MIGDLSNHLWQSTAFAAAAALLAWLLRANRAHVRYWIWFTASVKFLVPFSALMALGIPLAWMRVPIPVPPATAPVVSIVMEPFTNATVQPMPAAAARAATRHWAPPVVFGMWACGFGTIVALRIRQWRRIRAAVAASGPFEPAEYRDVPMRSAPGLLEPGVVGFWRPVLLLPAGIDLHLTPRQLDAVLEHELCHARRRDNLTAAVHMAVEAVFWFHPAVWWIGARLLSERERACDAHVLDVFGESRTYAEGILTVCRLYAESPLACVPGVTGAGLKRRLEDIAVNRMGLELGAGRRALVIAAAAAAIVVPVMCGVLSATPAAIAPQTGAVAPRFEVVSIRPCDSSAFPPGARGGGRGGMSPGRLLLECHVVKGLIQAAYVMFPNGKRSAVRSVFRTPIEGGPGWIASDRYTIEATATGTPSYEMMQGPMLQAVLEEHFKLKVRRETREIPALALTVAKGGPKMPRFQEGSCVPPVLTMPPSPQPALAPGERRCSRLFKVDGPNRALDAEGLTLAEFNDNFLSGSPGTGLSSIVLDRTGLSGRFDFHLRFAPGPDDPVRRSLIERGEDPGEPTAPDLMTALGQIGLRLEETKGPGDFIVIEHIEKPSSGRAQAASAPRFENVSIRPCAQEVRAAGGRGGGGSFTTSPGRLYADCVRVRGLINIAYVEHREKTGATGALDHYGFGPPTDDGERRVRNGPSWIAQDLYTIEATAASAVDTATLLGPMLRALLEERFRLKLHADVEEIPMYALTVAPGGLKIKPMAADACLERRDPGHAPTPDERERARREGKPFCGTMLSGSNGGNFTWDFNGQTLAEVAYGLSADLDRYILDRTGISDKFIVHLEFAPDEATPDIARRMHGEPPAAGTAGPSLFAALERLGLRLVPTKGPRGYLIVDHIERPALSGQR